MILMEVTSNIVTFASGKGGVGKSLVTVNVAEILAGQSADVAVVDADFGQGATPVLLNESPDRTVLDTVERSESALEARHETETGLTLVQGARRPVQRHGRDQTALYSALDKLLEHLRRDHDYIFIDAPSGTDGPVRWALDRADIGALVVVREPTAVADAYRLAKVLWKADPEYPLGLVVNYADTEDEAHSIAERFKAITTRFLGKAPRTLGWVPFASSIRESVSAQTPVVRTQGPVREAFRALAQSVARGQSAFSPALS